MTTTPGTSATAAAPLTHDCVRCGRPVALELALCEECNPLELAQPAASQAHGTVFLGIAAAVLGLAVLARLSVSDVGPFPAEVAGVAPAADGLSITLTVTNDGSQAGGTTCRVFRPADRGVGPSAFVQSPQLQSGATISFSAIVTHFGTALPEPGTLDVECSQP
jgi:hypothetical protein